MTMTIDEAIENAEHMKELFAQHMSRNYLGTIDLGIEALKREMLFRSRVPKKDWSLLPGETES